jgi:PERQ amino acid-rich with GYF domain-containing protein
MSTTMHFGPEWMRPKTQNTSRSSTREPSPPPAPTYSALAAPPGPPPGASQPPAKDTARPFRYSREEMVRIFRDGGGAGPLALEVERWDDVVRDAPHEPMALRPLSDADKKARGRDRSRVCARG